MRRYVLRALMVAVLVPLATLAEGAATSRQLTAEFSIRQVSGEAREHVFDYENPQGERQTVSRLDWQIRNVTMAGGQLAYALSERFALHGGAWFALTTGSGQMEDYDWLDADPASGWTHYSLSDVDVTQGYLLDFSVSMDIVHSPDISVQAVAGYKQDGWSWEDHAVYLLYPENGYNPEYLDGQNLINYEQEFQIPYVGFSADIDRGNFSFSAYGRWSPLVAASDWDHHVERELIFEETFAGGNMVGVGLAAQYNFSGGALADCFARLSFDYQRIDLIVGDTKITDEASGEVESAADTAGIECEYSSISLGFGRVF